MTVTETDQAPDVVHRGSVGSDESAPAARLQGLEAVLGSAGHAVVGRLWVLGGLLGGLVVAALTALSAIDQAVESPIFAEEVRAGLASVPLALPLLAVMPLALGLAVAVVPLQIGASSLAMPRVAAGAFWSWAVGSLLYVVGIFVAEADPTKMAKLTYLALGCAVLSLLGTAVSVAATVLTQRTAGMTLARVPFFTFSMLVATTVWFGNLPPVLARIAFAVIRRSEAADYSTFALADNTWLVRQPAVFALVVPVLGLVLDIAMTAARTAPRSVGAHQFAIGALGVLGFGAWTQSQTGTENIVYFAAVASLAIPVLATIGLVGLSLRKGGRKVPAPLLASVVALDVVLLGALVGVLQIVDQVGDDAGGLLGFAEVTQWLFLSQSYFVGFGALAGLVAGAAYWGDKVWGGRFPAGAALGSAGLVALGGTLCGAAWAAAAIGTVGDDNLYSLVTAVGAVVVGVGLLGAVGAALGAARQQGGAANPWDGVTLEWATSSPPADGNFPDGVAVVTSIAPLAVSEEADK